MLALGQTNLQFGAAVLPVEFERHDGVTTAFHRTDQAIEFVAVEQEFAAAHRVGHLVGRGRLERRDMGANQEGLRAAYIHIGLGELGTPGTHGLDLPTLEHQAGIVALFNEIFMARTAVFRDQATGIL